MNPWQLSPTAVALRVVILAAPQLALAAAPGPGSLWAIAAALVLSVAAAHRPVSPAALVTTPVVLVSWATADQTLGWRAAVAAAAVLAYHLACLVASLGPPQARVDPGLLRVWGVRWLLLLAPVPPLLLPADALTGASAAPSAAWVLGALAPGAVALVALRALRPDLRGPSSAR